MYLWRDLFFHGNSFNSIRDECSSLNCHYYFFKTPLSVLSAFSKVLGCRCRPCKPSVPWMGAVCGCCPASQHTHFPFLLAVLPALRMGQDAAGQSLWPPAWACGRSHHQVLPATLSPGKSAGCPRASWVYCRADEQAQRVPGCSRDWSYKPCELLNLIWVMPRQEHSQV